MALNAERSGFQVILLPPLYLSHFETEILLQPCSRSALLDSPTDDRDGDAKSDDKQKAANLRLTQADTFPMLRRMWPLTQNAPNSPASGRLSWIALLAGGAALVILSASAVTSSAEETRIADLRTSGWSEIEKREETKKLPGEAPYENLTRVIQFTYFVFAKDSERKACWISYDSQRDEIREGCEPAE